MRRIGSVLAVAAVAAVVLAATWDALRVAGSPAGEPEAEAVPALAAEGLRALGASGRILFSGEGCARRELSLPGLELAEVPRILGCDVFGHRGSLGVVDGEVGWYAYPGGVTTLLRRAELDREIAVGRAGGPGGHRVVATAWLRSTRYAALVEGPQLRGRLLALFERGALRRAVAELDEGWGRLRSSPRGGYFAALDGAGGLALYDARGEPVALPAELVRPTAIAWSPDERLAAVADETGIAVFPLAAGGGGLVRIPLPAHDLAWLRE